MTQHEDVTQILSRPTGQIDRQAVLESLRRNITVLFTDLKGSTSYFEKYGDAAGLLMVHRCNTMLTKAVESHGGRVIKTIGDAVMAAFEDPAEAIAASIEMQEVITADNNAKTDAQKIAIRIGINYGLGLVKSNDIFGDVVNVASRVESAAAPEQILISDTLYQAVSGTGQFRIVPRGKFALKGKADERDLFEVQWRADNEQPLAASHSMIMPVLNIATQVGFKLVQVRNDGNPSREFELSEKKASIGRTGGDFMFSNDAMMQTPHTHIVVESGQVFVEPVDLAITFFSLVGPYRLRHGDVIKIGAQTLEFHVNAAALEIGSLTGANIKEISAKLQHPVAEFISQGADQKRYSVLDEATWGRTKATYVFPTDSSMSRSHAKVYNRGEDFLIEDTGSTNGTFVRAREKTPVPPGAVLSIAGQLLRVSSQEK